MPQPWLGRGLIRMPIDIKQFYQAFFEESLEMLKGMEEALLQLDITQPEAEKINTIFRAVHTIKGGSGALGFKEISSFSHTVETFLSQIRAGQRPMKQEDITLLLSVIDCLGDMVKDLQNNKLIDVTYANELEQQFQQKLNEIPREDDNEESKTTQASPPTPESSPPTNIMQDATPKTVEANDHCAEKKNEIVTPHTTSPDQNKHSYKSEITTLRVAVSKVDNLVNQLVEMVISQSILNQLVKTLSPNNVDQLKNELQHLNRNLVELQESVMRIRMLPVAFIFQPFKRMVRETSAKLGKSVELKITGEETEFDKIMLDHINDPVMHLVRNALDHGIEPPEERVKMGKPPMGLLQLSAQQEGGNIVISIQDDGQGIDTQKVLQKAMNQGLIKTGEILTEEQTYTLLFRPGFSTADTVTEISGRGIGLDVVQKNIHTIGGGIEIKSTPGVGTTFILKFPLTLSIMECQLVKLSEHIFIIPLVSLTEISKIDPLHVHPMGDDIELYHLHDEYIPIIHLGRLFQLDHARKNMVDQFLMIVELEGQRYGLVVDELLGQQQIAIKSLEENYKKVTGISGATILGDGSIGLILDVYGVIHAANDKSPPIDIDSHASSEPILHLAPPEEELSEEIQLLSFKLGDKEYAVDMRKMIEIRKLGKTTPVPGAPIYVKGITNVHGVLVPVVNLRERFSLLGEENKISDLMYVLKIDVHGHEKTVGMLVDEIGDSYTVTKAAISEPPNVAENILTKYVSYIVTTKDKRMLTVLDTTDLFPFYSYEEIGV